MLVQGTFVVLSLITLALHRLLQTWRSNRVFHTITVQDITRSPFMCGSYGPTAIAMGTGDVQIWCKLTVRGFQAHPQPLTTNQLAVIN